MADNSHVPLAFEPRKLRSRVVYRKLRNHYFTASEKTWLCSSLTDACTSRKHRDRKVKTVCNRHSLSFTVLQEWMVVHSLNHEQFPGLCVHDTCSVDALGIAALVAFDADGRREDETEEAYVARWSQFVAMQEACTLSRRTAAALFGSHSTSK